MSNLVVLDSRPKAPKDLAAELRKAADAVDRGEITALVAAYKEGTEFVFIYGASIRDCLEFATILQHRCIERYRE